MSGAPTHIDLCAGFGGFSIAAAWAGFETVGFAEISPYAYRVLSQRWPIVPNHGDIRNTPAFQCDLLTCGDPCPPFSVAGRRLGEDDHRYLWPAVLDAIGRHNPDWCVLENVVGSKNMVLSGRIDDLETRGYQCEAFDIPSCAVGLPSVERHVWLVAARDGVRLERDVQESVQGRVAMGQEIGVRRSVDDGLEVMLRRSDLLEPKFCRSSKGVSNRVERITGIGNAVPPPVAYEILRTIRALI